MCRNCTANESETEIPTCRTQPRWLCKASTDQELETCLCMREMKVCREQLVLATKNKASAMSNLRLASLIKHSSKGSRQVNETSRTTTNFVSIRTWCPWTTTFLTKSISKRGATACSPSHLSHCPYSIAKVRTMCQTWDHLCTWTTSWFRSKEIPTTMTNWHSLSMLYWLVTEANNCQCPFPSKDFLTPKTQLSSRIWTFRTQDATS